MVDLSQVVWDDAPAAGGATPGNINLNNRPIVKNADGSISTIRSMSFNDGPNREVLIPTVSDDGRIMGDDEAIDYYRKSGRHLGIFATPDAATEAAKKLSAAQGQQYGAAPAGIDLSQVKWDDEPPTQAEADAIRMPQRFQKRAGPPEPWNGPTLPTTDEARAALEPNPNTRYGDILPLARDVDPAGNPIGSPRLALPNILRSPLLGALDIGQGRVQMDEAGNPLSIRPTPDSQNTLMSVVTPSPAMGTGRAIAETASHGAPLAELYSRNRLAPPPVPAQSVAAPVASSVAPELPLPAPEPVAAPAPSAASRAGVPDPVPAPEPQSVGAAASPKTMTNMTPAEAQASRTQGETRTLLEAPAPGDTTEYVKGILPTKAELELTPTVSREAKTLRMEKPEPFTELDVARNEIYQDHFDNLAGSATQVLRAREARAAQAETDLKAAWGAKTEANTQPLFEMAATIKAGPDGRRPLVRSALQSITDELIDAKGNPITDPEILYGVRKHISDMVSKEAQREKPLNQRAEAILLDIRGQLDEVIEGAAPGFRQYLDNYQTASRPIDVMELLQEAKPKITSGADRMIQFSRFDRLMKDLVSDRGASGVNAAKSIDEATWEQLVAMHKSLQRTAYARQLAQAPGSDTTQNMYDLAKKAGTVAAHGAMAMISPGVGNALLPLATKAMRDRRTTRDVINQLNPNRSKYPDRGP